MASENLKIDQNTRWTLGAITNDLAQEIKNARVNPATGRLIVEANITSSNTSIGSTIPGGTDHSVLFLGLGGTLDQDPTNFYYDYTDHFLGLGTTSPAATLHVDGSVEFDLGADATGDIFYRDSSGFLMNLPIGSSGQILTVSGGFPAWRNNSAAGGYNTIQNSGVSVIQRTTIDLSNLLTAADVGGKTALTINVANLAADSTFLSNLNLANISGQIDLTTQVSGQLPPANIDLTALANSATFISALEPNLHLQNIGGFLNLATQVTGLLSPTNIDITALEPLLSLQNLGGLLDLTSQVSGALPLANGGTGVSLSDPGYDAVYVWDNTTNTTRLADLSGLSYDTGTNTLTAIPSPISVTVMSMGDDFVGGKSQLVETGAGNGANTGGGELGWYGSATGAGSDTIAVNIPGEANHPGILRVTTVNGETSYVQLNPFISVVNGAQYTFIVRPISLARDQEVGFKTVAQLGAVDNSFYVQFDGSTDNIIFRTRNTTTTQSTTIGSYTDGDWFVVTFDLTTTSVTCTVTGFSPVTHSTNVPSSTVASFPLVVAEKEAGSFFDIDFYASYIPGLTR